MTAPEATSSVARDQFRRRLALIALVGFCLRLAWVIAERHTTLLTDGVYYSGLADALSHGRGFIDPYEFARSGLRIANANHTPAWPLLLTIPHFLGWNSVFPSQIWAAMVGTGTIVAMGYAGRAAVDERVGLFAAAITALYPNFWVYERELMSETLALLLVALTVLVAYRFRAHAGVRWSALLGGMCGLLAMTHPNFLLLAPLLCVPLFLLTPGVGLRERLTWLAVAAVTTCVVIAPWVAFNANRFREPVYMTTAFGLTLVDSNCQPAYYGARLGSWGVLCAKPIPKTNDAAVKDLEWRRRAQHYISSHADRLPIVVLAREGRTWGLFRPLQQNHFDSMIGSPLWVERLRLFSYWLLAPAAIAGAIIMRRRRISLIAPIALVVEVVVTVALSFGDTRYRTPAEVAIALLAAVTFATLTRWSAPAAAG